MEEDRKLDAVDLMVCRDLLREWLTKYQRDYGWWKNPLTYEAWMDDAIEEYEARKYLYEKLTKLLEEE